MFVLLVDKEDDYGPADVHGPFDTMNAAQEYAEQLRILNDLPGPATPENNEAWTEAGWYFGIFEPTKSSEATAALAVGDREQVACPACGSEEPDCKEDCPVRESLPREHA